MRVIKILNMFIMEKYNIICIISTNFGFYINNYLYEK